jgi:CRP-like cAMP-binding protein
LLDKTEHAEGVSLIGRNRILSAMSEADLHVLEPDLRQTVLDAGDIQYEPGYQVEWVYFPSTAVLSVVTVMADGRTVESDTIGYESAVGILAALGGTFAVSRTFTQISGTALRLPAVSLRRQALVSASLTKLLVRHALADMAQAHQSVACNALHDVNQRLCRWLLLSADRTGGDLIPLTQQYLSTMLGVQRTTVTEAERALRSRGLVKRHRGGIRILDRSSMEREACECYAAVRANMEHLLKA